MGAVTRQVERKSGYAIIGHLESGSRWLCSVYRLHFVYRLLCSVYRPCSVSAASVASSSPPAAVPPATTSRQLQDQTMHCQAPPTDQRKPTTLMLLPVSLWDSSRGLRLLLDRLLLQQLTSLGSRRLLRRRQRGRRMRERWGSGWCWPQHR